MQHLQMKVNFVIVFGSLKHSASYVVFAVLVDERPSVVMYFFHKVVVGAWFEEGCSSIFQCISVEGVYCVWFVDLTKADNAHYNPAQIELLCVWRVVRVINLFTHFMDSDEVSAKQEHYGCLGM